MPSYLITGAARGIGFEFVRQLGASKDNTVFALVRDKTKATQLSDLKLENVYILEADITDDNALKSAVTNTASVTGGTLDYLINNAAWRDSSRNALTLDAYGDNQLLAQDMSAAFNVNVIGVVFTINAFLPLLRKGSFKKVITLSSAVGDSDFTQTTRYVGNAPYSISKAAVNLAVARYAVELKDEGFIFLAISPGLVDTATTPPTPERLTLYKHMMNCFRRLAPHIEGFITPEESVRLQLDVIHRWKIEETGAFVSQYGTKQWLL